MINFFKLIDAYTLRARMLPAIIAAAPALAALALLISWQRLALSNFVATLGLTALLFALADLARKHGVRKESCLYKEMGGKPSITFLRRSSAGPIEAASRDRYRTFIASQLKMKEVSAEEEAVDQAKADEFYEQCGTWLRTRTRDAKKFPILFSELVTYGFRRNLYGVKWFALVVNVAMVGIAFFLLAYGGQVGWAQDLTMRIWVIFAVAAMHAVYFFLGVTRESVKEAARAYARELILSCETLMIGARAPSRRKA